jgi:hypothetical protein
MILTAPSKPNSRAALARFVTVEAVALILKTDPENIYQVDCWRYVIHVVGKGVSRFVSYADLPPIVAAEPPSRRDWSYWRKRWRQQGGKAPRFWLKFYQQQLQNSTDINEIEAWYQVIRSLNFALTDFTREKLNLSYLQQKYAIQSTISQEAELN